LWEPLGKDGAKAFIYLHPIYLYHLLPLSSSPVAGPKTDKLKLDMEVWLRMTDMQLLTSTRKTRIQTENLQRPGRRLQELR
jgi:hypothetical protein